MFSSYQRKRLFNFSERLNKYLYTIFLWYHSQWYGQPHVIFNAWLYIYLSNLVQGLTPSGDYRIGEQQLRRTNVYYNSVLHAVNMPTSI